MQIQEGIVVDANPAWIELFGVEEGLLGHPVMDLFDESSQLALRGALAFCLQGRWDDHTLKVKAILGNGSRFLSTTCWRSASMRVSPSIRLVLPSKPADDTKLCRAAVGRSPIDATTGFLHRRELIEALGVRCTAPPPEACVALPSSSSTNSPWVERDVGVMASEEVLAEFSKLLKDSVHPKEIVGRLGGVRFLVLLERGKRARHRAPGARS